MSSESSTPIQIAHDTYWVGVGDHPLGLQCNPYLILDGNDGVLIDPGSVLDFEHVLAQVLQLIPVERISTIALSHQDPDLCSSVTLFEEAGFTGRIATHWRASVLQRYYGMKSPFYLVNEHNYSLTLESGKQIAFIPTPYLHFPGAIATFDPESKVLFPGDLFGAFSTQWTFRADKTSYIEGMKAFHEHYMPSNDNIRPVMEVFLGMDIKVIAPQHGSVIDEDIRDYIIALRDLECGTMLNPIKRELASSGGYTGVVEQVIRRLVGMYGSSEVLEVLEKMDFSIDHDNLTISSFSYTGLQLWDAMFSTIRDANKQTWLSAVEPLVQKLANEYGIRLPQYYQDAKSTAQIAIEALTHEVESLRAVNEKLDATLRDSEEKLTRCPLTGLRNERYFTVFLQAAVEQAELEQAGLALIFVGVDGIADVSYALGKDAGDELIRNVGYLLQRELMAGEELFRLDGPNFVQVVLHSQESNAVQDRAEHLRRTVAGSTISLSSMTISIGTVTLQELRKFQGSPGAPSKQLSQIGLQRLRIAANRGGDTICVDSDISNPSTSAGTVVIADTDPVNVDVLRTALQALHYEVVTCADGLEALRYIEHGSVSVVIAEAVLPKLDGFALREALASSAGLSELPFILMGFEKDADSVARAQGIGIDHFFKKPYLLSEVIGTVRLQHRPLAG